MSGVANRASPCDRFAGHPRSRLSRYPFDRCARNRLEIQVGSSLKPQPFIQLHRRPHDIRRVERQRMRSGPPRPSDALVHECPADPLTPCPRRDRQQPNLRRGFNLRRISRVGERDSRWIE